MVLYLAPWPHNLNQTVVVHGMKFHFCKFCKCRKTQKVGFYTLTHSTSWHQDWHFYPEGQSNPSDNRSGNSGNCSRSNYWNSNGNGNGNKTQTTLNASTTSCNTSITTALGNANASSSTTVDQGTHSPVLPDPRHVDTDLDGLFFEGTANLVEVVPKNSALWMAPVYEEEEDADVSADNEPLWYCQFCLCPGFHHALCQHDS